MMLHVILNIVKLEQDMVNGAGEVGQRTSKRINRHKTDVRRGWERDWGGDVQMGVASDWAGLSLRRVLGFGGRVCGGNGLCHGLTDGNGWTARKWEWFRQGFDTAQPPAQPNGFGVGGLVRAAGCGLRRARPWGATVYFNPSSARTSAEVSVFVWLAR
jgi:hypothetical protein